MLLRPMRAVVLMSYQCLQGHVCMCWKPQTAAGGCAGTVSVLTHVCACMCWISGRCCLAGGAHQVNP